MASSNAVDQKDVEKLLGLGFWRRHWAVAVGLLVQPLFWTVGIISANYPFESEITAASQMMVEFASLLAAAWTFGFAYFWPRSERIAREMRRVLMRSKPADLVEALKGLRMPLWSFMLAVFGLILMILSALLAIGAAVFTFGPFLLISMWTMAFGSAIMIGTWVQLYLMRDTLGFLTELLPGNSNFDRGA